MSQGLNTETGDHTTATEKAVSISLGIETFTFSVAMSRYIFNKLTHDDWQSCGVRLRDHVADVRGKMALSGKLFHPFAPRFLREEVQRVMKIFVYDAFKARNVAEGNLEFQVDSLLAGNEYRV